MPDRPLLVDHIPAQLRSTLAALRISRSFDAIESFDPESFGECQRYRDE